jgi:hypothetical protein
VAGRWDAPGLGHDGTHEELRRRFEGKAAVVADGPLAAAGAEVVKVKVKVRGKV